MMLKEPYVGYAMLTGKVARGVQIAFNSLHKILMRQKELLDDEFYMVSLNG